MNISEKKADILRDENKYISDKKENHLTNEKYVTSDGILKYLENPSVRVRTFRTISSTNTYLKSIADEENEGLLVVADNQSAGRGRGGKSFLSPDGTGLYMSLLLKPEATVHEVLSITACAAVSVIDTVHKIAPGRDVGIKWVNDIFSEGKKICGILTESAFNMKTGGVNYVILGIGLNLFEPLDGFGEFSEIAGALFPYSDDTADMKCRTAAAIADRFMELYSNLSEKSFFEDYRRNLFIIGKCITVTIGSKQMSAIAVDIDKDFRLLVRYGNGREEYISSGETSIKPK